MILVRIKKTRKPQSIKLHCVQHVERNVMGEEYLQYLHTVKPECQVSMIVDSIQYQKHCHAAVGKI